ncbi:MAG: hypothetical protein E7319_01065 [Clostridiales bacterium]|nr:hypothetical protein [Clostridiales bacterium]
MQQTLDLWGKHSLPENFSKKFVIQPKNSCTRILHEYNMDGAKTAPNILVESPVINGWEEA